MTIGQIRQRTPRLLIDSIEKLIGAQQIQMTTNINYKTLTLK